MAAQRGENVTMLVREC